MTSSTVTSADGTRIAYSSFGSGPALIVVCGATQFRAFDSSLAVLAELLAPQHTVITYDRRGRGESGDTLPFSSRREIEDIAALIAGPAGGRAAILGFSSGSVLALEAAVAGLPIDKVVMYEPPFVVPGADFAPPPPDYLDVLHLLKCRWHQLLQQPFCVNPTQCVISDPELPCVVETMTVSPTRP